MEFTSPLFYKIALEDWPGKDIQIRSSPQPHCRPLQPLQRADPSYCASRQSSSAIPFHLWLVQTVTYLTALYQGPYWMLSVVWQYFQTNQWGLDPDLTGFQNSSTNCLCLNLTACIQTTVNNYYQTTKLLLKSLFLDRSTSLDSTMAFYPSPVPCCLPHSSAKGNPHGQAGHQNKRQDGIAIPSPLLRARQIHLDYALCFQIGSTSAHCWSANKCCWSRNKKGTCFCDICLLFFPDPICGQTEH